MLINSLQKEEIINGKDGVFMTNSKNTNEKKPEKLPSSKYTEGWIPIKGIENGYITLDNKSKVTGVKIKPR